MKLYPTDTFTIVIAIISVQLIGTHSLPQSPLSCNGLSCTWCNSPRMKLDCNGFCADCKVKDVQRHKSLKDVPVAGKPKVVRAPPPPFRGYPVVNIFEANDRFKRCCSSNLPAACQPLCRYDISLLEMNQHMLVVGDCSPEYMTLLLYCANDGNDNRKCCDVNLVTLNHPQCSEFCSDNANLIGPIRADHEDCILKMNTIMLCHWYGMNPAPGAPTLPTLATIPPATLPPPVTVAPVTLARAVGRHDLVARDSPKKEKIEETAKPGEIHWTIDDTNSKRKTT